MDQPVPDVDRADVERIVRRDFALNDQASALEALSSFAGQGPPHRVHLAALKLSSGSVTRLRKWIAEANLDFRDVLVAAEYPLAATKWSNLEDASEAQRQEAYQADWQQYQLWLQRT